MTRPELKHPYLNAAIRARVVPQKSEEDVWFKELGPIEAKDLEKAIGAHFKASTWMPKESELKPLAEQAERTRSAQSQARPVLAVDGSAPTLAPDSWYSGPEN